MFAALSDSAQRRDFQAAHDGTRCCGLGRVRCVRGRPDAQRVNRELDDNDNAIDDHDIDIDDNDIDDNDIDDNDIDDHDHDHHEHDHHDHPAAPARVFAGRACFHSR